MKCKPAISVDCNFDLVSAGNSWANVRPQYGIGCKPDAGKLTPTSVRKEGYLKFTYMKYGQRYY